MKVMMQFDCASTVAFIFGLETTAGLDRPPYDTVV